MPKDEVNHKNEKKTDGNNGQRLHISDSNNGQQTSNGDNGQRDITKPVVADQEKLLAPFLQSGVVPTRKDGDDTSAKSERPRKLEQKEQVSKTTPLGTNHTNEQRPFLDPDALYHSNPARVDLLKLRQAQTQNQSDQLPTLDDLFGL